jgi:hypothetical protein
VRIRDVLAGALLLNAIPHAIRGLAGQRGMTPLGGVNSPPAANIAWAGLNSAGGAAALGPGSWRRVSQREADERLRAVIWGIIAMAAFAAVYELGPGAAQHRLVRAELASSAAPGPRWPLAFSAAGPRWASPPGGAGRRPGLRRRRDGATAHIQWRSRHS